MALNTVRLYIIRRLVDSIFHDSNNVAYTTGIRSCLHAAFVGITHYANSALHASVCLWMFRIDHACLGIHYYTDNIT
jgi:hypothetical protein